MFSSDKQEKKKMSVESLPELLGIDLSALSPEQLSRIEQLESKIDGFAIVNEIERSGVSDALKQKLIAIADEDPVSLRKLLTRNILGALSKQLGTNVPNAFDTFKALVSNNYGIESLAQNEQALLDLYSYVMSVDEENFCLSVSILSTASQTSPAEQVLFAQAFQSAENFGRQFSQLLEGQRKDVVRAKCVMLLINAFIDMSDHAYQRGCLREELERYNFSQTLDSMQREVQDSEEVDDINLWVQIDRYKSRAREDEERTEERFRELLGDDSSSVLDALASNLQRIYASRVEAPRLYSAAVAVTQLLAQLSFSEAPSEWLNAYDALYNVSATPGFWNTCSAKSYSPSEKPLLSLEQGGRLLLPSKPISDSVVVAPVPPTPSLIVPGGVITPGPPPPPMGVAPPPPPPPTAARKPKIQPPKSSVKMRPFQWQKIPPTAPTFDVSVFEPFDRIDDVQLEPREIEELFGIESKETEKKKRDVERRRKEERGRAAAAPERISVFGPKKSQLVMIFLSSFRAQDVDQVIERIRDGNITLEQVAQVRTMLPNREEFAALLGLPEDANLAEPEAFVYALVRRVRDIEERLAILDYTLRVGEEAEVIEELSDNISAAARAIQESAQFADMLRILLRVGNFMNQNTSKGDAFAYTVDALSRVPDTKSPRDASENLLTYLVEFVHRDYPEKEAFLEQLAPVSAAEQLNIAEIAVLLSQLDTLREAAIKGYRDIQDARAIDGQDALLDKYSGGVASLPGYAQAREALEKAQAASKITFDYFALDPAKTDKTLRTIFRIVSEFIRKYARALVALRETEIRKEKLEILERKTREQQQEQKPPKKRPRQRPRRARV